MHSLKAACRKEFHNVWSGYIAIAVTTMMFTTSCGDGTPVSPPASANSEISQARGVTGFTYTTIAHPGARLTFAYGINARGVVAGYYVDSSFVYHGFTWMNGEFTTIDYPGAAGTDVRGIAPNGEVVGNYWLAGEPGLAYHGFRMTVQGDFIPVHYSGHTYEILQRLLPDGTILGCRHDTNLMSTMRGITIADGFSSELSQVGSMTNGATPDLGTIVGQYANTAAGNRTEGFAITDGIFTPIYVPGSSLSNAWDINAGGQIVGVYSLGGVHGFILTNLDYSTMVTLNVPGATATRAFGINASGDVVGAFVQGGKTYAFLARGTHGKSD